MILDGEYIPWIVVFLLNYNYFTFDAFFFMRVLKKTILLDEAAAAAIKFILFFYRHFPLIIGGLILSSFFTCWRFIALGFKFFQELRTRKISRICSIWLLCIAFWFIAIVIFQRRVIEETRIFWLKNILEFCWWIVRCFRLC